MDTEYIQERDRFISRLKKHSMKATSQRLAVHEAMYRLGHASADMVCEHIASKCTSVTTASVYNILNEMAEIGIYRRRFSSNNKMYFDVTTAPHIHLYDKENHAYKDVFDDELMEMIESKLRKRRFRGYSVDSIDIQLVCHPTRKKIKFSE